MKAIFSTVALCMWGLISVGQDLNGKWQGKLTQGPGGYSQLYNFDLYLNHGKKVTGNSDAYISKVLKVRISLDGNLVGDSVILAENFFGIIEELVPPDYIACIKNLRLKYLKMGNAEFLKGTWDGIAKDDSSPCIPGFVILSRRESDLQWFFDNGGFKSPPSFSTSSTVIPEFNPQFNNREVKKISEIEVSGRELEFRLNDYMKIDNDTVSIYFNRKLIAGKKRIAKKPIKFKLTIDPGTTLNEVLLYAENLGQIPPNTSQLLIIDGRTKHRILIESDKQKTAAVYLTYKP